MLTGMDQTFALNKTGALRTNDYTSFYLHLQLQIETFNPGSGLVSFCGRHSIFILHEFKLFMHQGFQTNQSYSFGSTESESLTLVY